MKVCFEIFNDGQEPVTCARHFGRKEVCPGLVTAGMGVYRCRFFLNGDKFLYPLGHHGDFLKPCPPCLEADGSPSPTPALRVFICSPYRAPDCILQGRNRLNAQALCRKAICAGYAPFAPHLFYPPLLDDRDPVERAQGLKFAKAWLAVSDRVWQLAGPVTEGMQGELDLAARLGIPVEVVEL